MNSESGKSYMDKLKVRNIPPQVQAEMQMEEEIPTVQISVAEWDELIASVNRLEELSVELKAQKAAFAAEAASMPSRLRRRYRRRTRRQRRRYERSRRKPPNRLGKRARELPKLSTEEFVGTTHCGGFAWRTRRFR